MALLEEGTFDQSDTDEGQTVRKILTSVSCEWCEVLFEPDIDNEAELDEAMQAAGWLFLESDGEQHDFCGTSCLRSWLPPDLEYS